MVLKDSIAPLSHISLAASAAAFFAAASLSHCPRPAATRLASSPKNPNVGRDSREFRLAWH